MNKLIISLFLVLAIAVVSSLSFPYAPMFARPRGYYVGGYHYPAPVAPAPVAAYYPTPVAEPYVMHPEPYYAPMPYYAPVPVAHAAYHAPALLAYRK